MYCAGLGAVYFGARAVELVDDPVYSWFVAGDGAGGENDNVVALDPDLTVLAGRDQREGRERLPLGAGADHHSLLGSKAFQLLDRDEDLVGYLQVAELAADLGVGNHRAAHERDPAAVLLGRGADLLDAMEIGSEAGNEDAARCPREHLLKPLPHHRFGLRPAPAEGVRGVRQHEVDPVAAGAAETLDVCLAPVDRSVVELEVAGVEDPAAGRIDDHRDRVRNRVGHRQKAALEGAKAKAVEV